VGVLGGLGGTSSLPLLTFPGAPLESPATRLTWTTPLTPGNPTSLRTLTPTQTCPGGFGEMPDDA
jgi:hypothetical protein